MSLPELLAGPVVEVAPALLGWRLRSRIGGVTTQVAIDEVEAYDGANDPASHAFGGPTRRNATMFGPSGRLYVYRAYGIHWCMNVVVGEPGRAAAVLLRGGVPQVGRAEMARRRGRDVHLCDGPGKLCQALGVTGKHDGSNLLGRRGLLSLRPGEAPSSIQRTPRIGINKATDLLWRFVAVGGPAPARRWEGTPVVWEGRPADGPRRRE